MLGGKEGFIRLGDKVEGGGEVISASGNGFKVDGLPVALLNDTARCDTHQGVFPLVEGDPDCIIDGRPAAFDKMKLACGCRVLSSCNYQWGRSPTVPTQARSPVRAPALQSTFAASSDEKFDEQLQFVAYDGRPVAKIQYRLTLADGSRVSGRTDSNGFTERVVTGGPVAITEAQFSARDAVKFCCAKEAHGGEGKSFSVPGVVTNTVSVGGSSIVVKVPEGESRPLTPGEIAMARSIFKDSVEYSVVKVFNADFLPFGLQEDWTTITPNGNLYCPVAHYVDDFSVAAAWRRHLFMHEMVHVWQFQMGYPVMVVGVPLQGTELVGNAIGKSVYSYVITRTHHIDRVSLSGQIATRWTEVPHLSSFNMEQQGDLISDYYCLTAGMARAMSESGLAITDATLFRDVLSGFLAEPNRTDWLPGRLSLR